MVPVEHGAGQVSSVDDPDGFTHRFANVNGIRLHFVEEGEGPLVVFLHGYPTLRPSPIRTSSQRRCHRI